MRRLGYRLGIQGDDREQLALMVRSPRRQKLIALGHGLLCREGTWMDLEGRCRERETEMTSRALCLGFLVLRFFNPGACPSPSVAIFEENAFLVPHHPPAVPVCSPVAETTRRVSLQCPQVCVSDGILCV